VATVKMEPILEHGGDQPEPKMELSLILPTIFSPSASDLVEVTKSSLSTLTVRLIPMPGFRFLADVPPKTPISKIALIARHRPSHRHR